MIEPTEKDIGRKVVYCPRHAHGNLGHPDCERGKISSFNAHYVHVRYGKKPNSQATSRDDLFWDENALMLK